MQIYNRIVQNNAEFVGTSGSTTTDDKLTANLAGVTLRKLNYLSDRVIKVGAKSRLRKRLLDLGIGTRTVEAMAAVKIAE